jgi:hypothetical protein
MTMIQGQFWRKWKLESISSGRILLAAVPSTRSIRVSGTPGCEREHDGALIGVR